jgi:hypothetical protein
MCIAVAASRRSGTESGGCVAAASVAKSFSANALQSILERDEMARSTPARQLQKRDPLA